MKLSTLDKYLSEDRKLSEMALLIEGQYPNHGDLEDFPSETVKPGVGVLIQISQGKTEELTSDDIELAMKTWQFLRRLLINTIDPLKDEIKTTNIAKAYRKEPGLKMKDMPD